MAYHFADVSKMVSVGSGAEREIDDIYFTRYACYLTAQNGDARKPAIAFAQNYYGTFIKYYKISQLIHTQSIAN